MDMEGERTYLRSIGGCCGKRRQTEDFRLYPCAVGNAEEFHRSVNFWSKIALSIEYQTFPSAVNISDNARRTGAAEHCTVTDRKRATETRPRGHKSVILRTELIAYYYNIEIKSKM